MSDPTPESGSSEIDAKSRKATGFGERTRKRAKTSLLARGEPMLWLTGGGLCLCVIMIVMLLVGIVYAGMRTFWPSSLVEVTLHNGDKYLGEITTSSTFTPESWIRDRLEGAELAAYDQEAEDTGGALERRQFRTGNFRLTNTHFTWVSAYQIAEENNPEWALTLERRDWGNFYGYPDAFLVDGEEVATDPAEVWQKFQQEHPKSTERWDEIYHLKEVDLGVLSREREEARLAVKRLQMHYDDLKKFDPDSSSLPKLQQQISAAEAEADAVSADVDQREAKVKEKIMALEAENNQYVLRLRAANGQTTQNVVADIVRPILNNQLSFGEKFGVYMSRWREFIFDPPRHANLEGGVYPAIFGTVVMTLIMTLVVVPFGVLAALYLREYAKSGPLVSVIRIAINNLAGVPSIVFGVFGMGFFSYTLGKWIDVGLPREERYSVVEWTLYGLIGLGAVVLAVGAAIRRNQLSHHKGGKEGFDVISAGIGAVAIGLFCLAMFVVTNVLWGCIISGVTLAALAMAYNKRKNSMDAVAQRTPVWLDWAVPLAWLTGFAMVISIITFNPFFNGFYPAQAQSHPVYGSGGIMWASLTLALLTLPVVIVATEEALAAVPRSMREGSYACGASKWQTIKRIVLPRAMPGIMTGSILAMARGAGEVAPLMLVGAVKLAPDLPFTFKDLSGSLGFIPLGPLHPERSFMHLGFHIFDLGFQSQNSEAARPMVFTTTLLLILIIVVLNMAAIYLRGRLRRRFGGNQF